MATIKSYTDISQAKVLADILPLESADMYHFIDDIDKVYEVGFGYRKITADYYSKTKLEYISCWSLSALLELLPKRLEIEDTVYELSVYLYGLYYWNIINGNLCFESKDKNNLVDACYDAIVFLHEQKLL